MEDVEFTSISESSGLSSGAEVTPEKREKQREVYKKAQAQLQKAQKDEKKAKKDNDELFELLFRFIQNPLYEELIPVMTGLLQIAVPSRFLIAVLMLIYPEAALYVSTFLGKKEVIDIMGSLHRYDETEIFHEQTLHTSIRNWMSTWVQDSNIYLSSPDSSHILQKKMSTLFESPFREQLIQAMSQIITFFFTSRNIAISQRVSDSYATFILNEYIIRIKKLLEGADPDLISITEVDATKLF